MPSTVRDRLRRKLAARAPHDELPEDPNVTVLFDDGMLRIVELPDGTKLLTQIVLKGQEPPPLDPSWKMLRSGQYVQTPHKKLAGAV